MSKPSATPVTELKRHATEIIADLARNPGAVMVTEHGRSAAVLMDLATYESLVRRVEVLEGISRGERAFVEGRVVTHEQASQRLERWLRHDDRA
ncbi:MAG: type II toxin-antitoxin system Phd/YefM family antitoxin [Polyangiaceae bacterium]|nr:type II toxin-antitoxin system Phd/YefM family antitoxin [Polyangiaceae bacterium]